MDSQTAMTALVRFLHIAAGVVWIGHLYFFNLTNVPVFGFKVKGGDPAVKGQPALILRALFWFRWGAMFTLIFGLWLLDSLVRTYGITYGDFFATDEGKTIAIGMAMGIIMWFNVWFIIWPNQKVVLGNSIKIAGGVTPEEKARLEAYNAPRAKNAKMASRVNFWLSIPMLLFMVFAAHAPFAL
jgi:uncharacterized membrane protein